MSAASSDCPAMVRPSSLTVVAMVDTPSVRRLTNSGSTTGVVPATSTACPGLSVPTSQPCALTVLTPVSASATLIAPVRTFQRTVSIWAAAALTPPLRARPSSATPLAQPFRMLKTRASAAGLPSRLGIGSAR
jgi:hypothetical protein